MKLEIPQTTLAKNRRYVCVANIVMCTLMTSDFMSSFVMIVPLQVFFEICVQLGTREPGH